VRVALIDTTKDSKFYPLPLLKISSWRKSLGDTTTLFDSPPPRGYDRAYVTTTFTFDILRAVSMVRKIQQRVAEVYVGGISATLIPKPFENLGVTVIKGLMPEVEQFPPDYSLIENPVYSIAHTSRGCIRKCGFCMVKNVEPEFYNRDWSSDIFPGCKHVVFYDNNWLAKEMPDLKKDVLMMKGFGFTSVDFNQSLDARLMTVEKALLLRDVPLRPVRFAFDWMAEDKFFQTAVTLMAELGHRVFVVDVLWNYTDTPEDLYYRIREHFRLMDELNAKLSHHVDIKAFPMMYRPIMEIDPYNSYIGEHWTKTTKEGFRTLVNKGCSVTGTLSFSGIKEFEYWFGKSPREFVELLNYPDLKKLCSLKRSALRLKRASRSTDLYDIIYTT
jgi:hypothetical protein